MNLSVRNGRNRRSSIHCKIKKRREKQKPNRYHSERSMRYYWIERRRLCKNDSKEN